MINWKESTLGELARLGNGLIQTGPFGSQLHKADYVEEGIPCLMPINLKNNRIDISKVSFISESDANRLSKHIVKPGDVIYSRRGDVTQKALITDKEAGFFCGTGCLLVRVGNSIDPGFLVYFLSSPQSKSWILNNAVGITMPNLNTKILSRFPISLPSSNEQKKIANILSDLDAKIELNNKINTELEAMAKLIYDYWFVQFDFPDEEGKPYKSSGGKMVYNEELKREIPGGWEVRKLGTLGNFKNGVNYDPSNPGEIACPIVNVRNISASSYFLKNEDLDTIYLRESDVRKYAVHEGSIIIARSGIPGATRLISDFEKNTLYCGFAIHYELENLIQKIPVFFYLKSIEQMIKNGSGGTILKNVNQATLNDLSIVLPTKNQVIDTFNGIIDPMFDKINLIQKENQKLSDLRDWLLPMLMNGQVKVK